MDSAPGGRLSRAAGDEAFRGDALVIVCPTRSVSPDYQQSVLEFVASGGNLLVLDSADVEGSTANSLLWPFGLSSRHDTPAQENAKLRCAFSAPEVPLAAACEISGGEPLAWLGETPVAAQAQHGKGRVTAVGFGSLFDDENMGFHWLPEPESAVRERYEVLYGLLRRSLPKGDERQVPHYGEKSGPNQSGARSAAKSSRTESAAPAARRTLPSSSADSADTLVHRPNRVSPFRWRSSVAKCR